MPVLLSIVATVVHMVRYGPDNLRIIMNLE